MVSEAKEYQPDEKLTDFLENGEKPILLALGAMSFEEEAETKKLDMFVKAFEKTGHRAIIQGFQKTLKEYELPESMIAVGSVPHSFLLDKCKMVFHHCGFGTASATLIYGVPSVPVPHVLDQMGFADLIFKLGVASEPINGNKMTEAEVIERIQDMELHYEERALKVRELSEKIKQENGLQNAVGLIKAVLA